MEEVTIAMSREEIVITMTFERKLYNYTFELDSPAPTPQSESSTEPAG